MVKLDTVHASNATLVQRQPLVTVFFGGTGGIGSFTIRALASTNGQTRGAKPRRTYIVGRAEAADEFITQCKDACPNGEFGFIKAGDMALISEIDRLCGEVRKAEEQYGDRARIDYLMVSQAEMPYKLRKDTKEGLDTTIPLMYYSRMRMITNLFPPPPGISPPRNRYLDLQARPRPLAHVLHVQFVLRSFGPTPPGEALTDSHLPGLVPGPGFNNKELPLWFRVLFNGIVLPIFGRWITLKPGKCGQRMLSLAAGQYPPGLGSFKAGGGGGGGGGGQVAITATDGKSGSGVYSLNWDGESKYPTEKYAMLDKEKVRTQAYEHKRRPSKSLSREACL